MCRYQEFLETLASNINILMEQGHQSGLFNPQIPNIRNSDPMALII